jgi:thiosulfate/3-mercaptopyruvate sulfurtransferase
MGQTPRAGLLLVHVGAADTFRLAHVPGAVLVQPGELIDGRPPASGRLPDVGRLTDLFRRLGYAPDLEIVVYDDEGGGWAGRFAWTLDVIGHHHWCYLNGGLAAWHQAGLPLEQGEGLIPEPSTASITIDPGPIAEAEDVMRAIDDPDQVIWDVRSAEEYAGLRSGSRRAGHVPGAVNLDWQLLKDPSRGLRLREDLADLLPRYGIDPGRQIITHCQTHHRSGLSYMVGRLLGYDRIRAYQGSWAEWGNRDDTPITTGSLTN